MKKYIPLILSLLSLIISISCLLFTIYHNVKKSEEILYIDPQKNLISIKCYDVETNIEVKCKNNKK